MKLASIETIDELTPHPNADALDIARVLGWQCIVRKREFSKGDKVVFIPIDTLLPVAPWSAFLRKSDTPVRLKTIKLRGQYSQGLVLPLSVLPEPSQSWHIGADVGGELGVKKYEKEIPACLTGKSAGTFPLHLAPRTDEDNGCSHPEIVEATLQHPRGCVVTQKLDGSSCTIILEGGKVTHVCSRNQSILPDDTNGFWRVARKLQRLEDLPPDRYVIQGELMGPGVQGNQLALSEPQLYVYSMGDADGWLSYESMKHFCSIIGTRIVPLVTTSIPKELTLQQLADSQVLPDGSPAEGIVVRVDPPVSMGCGRPIGFKIINRNYKDT